MENCQKTSVNELTARRRSFKREENKETQLAVLQLLLYMAVFLHWLLTCFGCLSTPPYWPVLLVNHHLSCPPLQKLLQSFVEPMLILGAFRKIHLPKNNLRCWQIHLLHHRILLNL